MIILRFRRILLDLLTFFVLIPIVSANGDWSFIVPLIFPSYFLIYGILNLISLAIVKFNKFRNKTFKWLSLTIGFFVWILMLYSLAPFYPILKSGYVSDIKIIFVFTIIDLLILLILAIVSIFYFSHLIKNNPENYDKSFISNLNITTIFISVIVLIGIIIFNIWARP